MLHNNLTDASLDLFLRFAKDAGNWSGQPLVGGNFTVTRQDKGNLTDLKKHGLLTTFADDGDAWIDFTPSGKALAAQHGIVIEN